MIRAVLVNKIYFTVENKQKPKNLRDGRQKARVRSYEMGENRKYCSVASSKFQCQLIYFLCLTGAFYSLWFADLLACSCIKIRQVK